MEEPKHLIDRATSTDDEGLQELRDHLGEPANHKRHKEVEQEIAQQPQKKMKFINFVQQTKGV